MPHGVLGRAEFQSDAPMALLASPSATPCGFAAVRPGPLGPQTQLCLRSAALGERSALRMSGAGRSHWTLINLWDLFGEGECRIWHLPGPFIMIGFPISKAVWMMLGG